MNIVLKVGVGIVGLYFIIVVVESLIHFFWQFFTGQPIPEFLMFVWYTQLWEAVWGTVLAYGEIFTILLGVFMGSPITGDSVEQLRSAFVFAIWTSSNIFWVLLKPMEFLGQPVVDTVETVIMCFILVVMSNDPAQAATHVGTYLTTPRGLPKLIELVFALAVISPIFGGAYDIFSRFVILKDETVTKVTSEGKIVEVREVGLQWYSRQDKFAAMRSWVGRFHPHGLKLIPGDRAKALRALKSYLSDLTPDGEWKNIRYRILPGYRSKKASWEEDQDETTPTNPYGDKWELPPHWNTADPEHPT